MSMVSRFTFGIASLSHFGAKTSGGGFGIIGKAETNQSIT
jgi:hypothetical protein